MTREQLERLERDASSMGTANHGRYVSEAILAMRDPACASNGAADEPEAPLRALRLLDAMWGSAHARRPDQRAALNNLGGWLESRLASEPRVEVEVLLAEMGWLKRLARHYEAERNEAAPANANAAVQKCFGQRLGEIELKRRAAFAGAKPSLPDVLVVRFKEFSEARAARKLAAERAKKKKEPREALLPLVATAPAAAGVHLVCSTTRTEGMVKVMERVRQTPGAPDWLMEAHGMMKEGDAVFVGRLSLTKAV